MTAHTPEDLLPMITAAINAGDPKEVLKYWDEDGCFAMAGGPAAQGHTELLKLYEHRLAFQPAIIEPAENIQQVGDIALVTSTWSTRLRKGQIDGRTSFEGVASLVLRRHADGGWRILIDAVS